MAKRFLTAKQIQEQELYIKYTDFVKDNTFEQYKDFKNKHLLFLKLKNSTVPLRNALTRQMFYLAGISKNYKSGLLSVKKNSSCSRFNKETYHHIWNLNTDLKSNIHKACKKYLKEYDFEIIDKATDLKLPSNVRCFLRRHDGSANKILRLLYNINNIDWCLVEYDLLKYHSKNVYVNSKNHSVYCIKHYTHNLVDTYINNF